MKYYESVFEPLFFISLVTDFIALRFKHLICQIFEVGGNHESSHKYFFAIVTSYWNIKLLILSIIKLWVIKYISFYVVQILIDK